jgi:hypothetical protein
VVRINGGNRGDIGFSAGADFGHELENVIMEGYSECHWPGGQLRVSSSEFKAEFSQLPKG